MKRKIIITILCTMMVICMISASVICVSAETNTNMDYNGTVLPTIPDFSSSRQYATIVIDSDGITYEVFFSTKQFVKQLNNKYELPSDSGFYSWQLKDGVWTAHHKNASYGASKNVIVWSNYDLYDINGNLVTPTTVPTEPKCDGSTCPATDLNQDNICDDCGAMFSVLRNYTPSDFPSGYPSVPSLNMPDANYYLYEVNSTGREYLVVYPSAVNPTYDTTKQNGYLYFSESYGSYEFDKTNNEWVLSNDDSPYFIGGTNNNSVEIKYSSDTIYDQNGDTFFPIPLWMEMDNLTQGEMENNLNPTVVGILTTLMVCGVGCLALLVVLKLFGKRSLISR